MKSENKNALLSRLEETIESQINLVVTKFQNEDSNTLLKMGNENKWSIAQNLEHLNFYFQYYNPAIEKAIESAQESDKETFKSSWLGNYFTNAMDLKKGGKMKAFKDYIPAQELDVHRVIAEFIAHSEKILGLLRKSKQYDLNKIKVAISLSRWIKINLGDVFQFVLMHNERHLKYCQDRLN